MFAKLLTDEARNWDGVSPEGHVTDGSSLPAAPQSMLSLKKQPPPLAADWDSFSSLFLLEVFTLLCRYPWPRFQRNYEIYILPRVVFECVTHASVRQRRRLCYTHPRGNDACLGSGGVTARLNHLQEKRQIKQLLLRSTPDYKNVQAGILMGCVLNAPHAWQWLNET